MSWRYELCCSTDATGVTTFAVHEVYHNKDGEFDGYTESPAWPQGETWAEFQKDFARYQAAALTRRSKARVLPSE